MKKLTWLTITSLFIIILSACGSSVDEEESSSGSDQSSDKSLYEQIQEEGVLTVGTEGTYAPYTFHNENDELTGYDVEVAKEIGKRLDLEIEFKETKWDSMFAGLNSNRFDMIANQVGIKPDREEKYSFSVPYTYTSAVLVARKDNNDMQSFEDLEGAVSAQSLTSNYADIAKEYGAEIQSVEGFNPAMELLNNDRVDATVNDRLSVLDYLKEKGDQSKVEIVAKEDNASETAMMFRQDNPELVEAVSGALKEMKEDGTLEEISNEWFNEDVSTQ
ncbi:amino acid ABC transporter substrate-binding protein [Halobacillus halophilus]|uniref:ABC-type transport system extracellular binding protein (Probable substrate amino acid) n=1 Tax=Halobacillus halophilus (strain ATCC 35676 / DSM 2266 / JCM 20832 / KCTC 3685 / LMG 17431 / NBRC 102448 / NCIMB 2269) TaxID=866895 RepID=I0JIG3_HALH3|nr:amino acid ABC transporter substrate-binding protein [Halobacillus halophilus]ASF38114.1 amino acid ABC transporter substrate-binding protein [Halobacillus halophilus]CCG43931.1 ABC-type transport system extracellular binding protein (probable substrate amino acid) [Halobacillus halophilus DSM 2266]